MNYECTIIVRVYLFNFFYFHLSNSNNLDRFDLPFTPNSLNISLVKRNNSC